MMFTVTGFAQSKTIDSKPIGQAKTKPLVVKTISVESTTYRQFTATFYSLRGKMANGQQVHKGAIAADLKVLPLGTIVHIEGMGIFTVKDSGSAIKGNIVDIWVADKKKALQFGRKKIKLRVISYGNRNR